MGRAVELATVLEPCDSLVIVCHDNPDPDTLSSAVALQTIATELGCSHTSIGFGGEISHQQNRAFVDLFELDVDPLDRLDVERYDCLAFVDHSRPGANTSLSTAHSPDIVVDHHPGEPVSASFVDVRTEYGATATIFVEYLLELEIPRSTRLASALLFALHRERLDFVRDPSRHEYEAALTLYPDADLETLETLYGSAFSPATIDAIGRAITARDRRGAVVVANVGHTPETDALPQAADYLLNVEGVDTTLAFGIVNGSVRLSGRSIDRGVNVGAVLTEAYGEVGSVGGHHDMAGGHLPLDAIVTDPDVDGATGGANATLEAVATTVTDRFFETLDLE